jgi:hypothetical protein
LKHTLDDGSQFVPPDGGAQCSRSTGRNYRARTTTLMRLRAFNTQV